MKTVIMMLLYAALGFTTTILILSEDLRASLGAYTQWFIIGVTIVAGIAILFDIFSYNGLRRNILSKDTADVDMDALDERLYRRYADMSLANTIALIFSILALGLGLITEMALWFIILNTAILLMSLILQFASPELMKKMYPERDLPSLSDDNYADKLLQASDDGERHVMLRGLYRAFSNTTFLLLIALVILIVYSIVTENVQVVGMILVSAILVISHAQYVFSIRDKG